MKRIRGGRGLGDSIYLRPIVEHFLRAREPVTVLSDYPGVFAGLSATVEPFSRFRVDVLAHYVLGKANPTTNQWQDICNSARVNVPLRFAWEPINHELLRSVAHQASGRPVVLVHGGRTPMGRTDGFGAELLPQEKAFRATLDALGEVFLVRIGSSAASPSQHPVLAKSPPLYDLPCHLNLSDQTTVTDLLDLASTCDGVVGQCSFVIPLAEALDKPLLIVWAAVGLASRTPYIAQITPAKVLSKPSSWHVSDDWDVARIAHVTDAWLKTRYWPEEIRACAS